MGGPFRDQPPLDRARRGRGGGGDRGDPDRVRAAALRGPGQGLRRHPDRPQADDGRPHLPARHRAAGAHAGAHPDLAPQRREVAGPTRGQVRHRDPGRARPDRQPADGPDPDRRGRTRQPVHHLLPRHQPGTGLEAGREHVGAVRRHRFLGQEAGLGGSAPLHRPADQRERDQAGLGRRAAEGFQDPQFRGDGRFQPGLFRAHVDALGRGQQTACRPLGRGAGARFLPPRARGRRPAIAGRVVPRRGAGEQRDRRAHRRAAQADRRPAAPLHRRPSGRDRGAPRRRHARGAASPRAGDAQPRRQRRRRGPQRHRGDQPGLPAAADRICRQRGAGRLDPLAARGPIRSPGADPGDGRSPAAGRGRVRAAQSRLRT